MKIKHFITIDTGTGPTSFVEVGDAPEVTMLRIVHRARFERTKPVDGAKVREMLQARTDLGAATTRICPDIAETLTREILTYLGTTHDHPQALRWRADGEAICFRTDADAKAYDQANAGQAEEAPVRKRRRVMMG